jgi:hypothetical protein
MIGKHFMSDIHRKLWITINRPDELLNAINNAPDIDEGDFIKI